MKARLYTFLALFLLSMSVWTLTDNAGSAVAVALCFIGGWSAMRN